MSRCLDSVIESKALLVMCWQVPNGCRLSSATPGLPHPAQLSQNTGSLRVLLSGVEGNNTHGRRIISFFRFDPALSVLSVADILRLCEPWNVFSALCMFSV